METEIENIKHQSTPLCEAMDMIAKAFEPKDHTFTIIETAFCETRNGDITEDVEISFELIGEFGGYHWQHTEFGRGPQTGEVFETALEAYDDAVSYTEKLAEKRSDKLQSEYAHYRLGGGYDPA